MKFCKHKKKKFLFSSQRIISRENGLRVIAPRSFLKKSLRSIFSKQKYFCYLDNFIYRGINNKELAYFYRFYDPSRKNIFGGKGLSKEQAIVSGICESIERTTAAFPLWKDRIIRASFKDVKDTAINPKEFFLPSAFPVRYKENLKIGWYRGYSLLRDKQVLVPADFIFSRNIKDILDEIKVNKTYPINYGTNSIGLASGKCKEEALLHGILEVLERDTHTIIAYNLINMPELVIDKVQNNKIIRIINDLKTRNVKIGFKLWDTDMPISVIATVLKYEQSQRFTYNIGCHFDPEIALSRSLTEAISLDWHLRGEFRYQHPLRRLFDKYSKRKLLSEIPKSDSQDIKEYLIKCVNMLKNNTFVKDIIISDLTSNIFKVPVLKTIVLGLQPLINFPFIRESQRLKKIPEQCKIKPRGRFIGTLCGAGVKYRDMYLAEQCLKNYSKTHF